MKFQTSFTVVSKNFHLVVPRTNRRIDVSDLSTYPSAQCRGLIHATDPWATNKNRCLSNRLRTYINKMVAKHKNLSRRKIKNTHTIEIGVNLVLKFDALP